MPEFEKVVIFGTGLIGGSFSLALKEAGAVEKVVGFGRTPATLRKAQELGVPVFDEAGKPCAHATGTFKYVRALATGGRQVNALQIEPGVLPTD